MVIEACETIFHTAKAAVDRLSGYQLLHRKFRRRLGYDLSLSNPRTMNEKIQWRKVNDRRLLLATISDKLGMQDYVRGILSADEIAGLFVPSLQVTEDPNAIKLADLPRNFVMKPTHGSGWVHVQKPTQTLSEPDLQRLAKKWMRKRYGIDSHQWAYTQLKPRIMIEERLGKRSSEPVDEVKLHVFGGRIQQIFYTTHVRGRAYWFFFDRDWTPLNKINGLAPITKPANYEWLALIAEKVAQDFDYIRVDFMVAQEGCFLNELTAYNASGFDVDPEGGAFSFDAVDGIGKHWTLPAL
jgi:hypothetical protein